MEEVIKKRKGEEEDEKRGEEGRERQEEEGGRDESLLVHFTVLKSGLALCSVNSQ